MRVSGHRIFLPEIKDVGILRQRYPIAPVHAEGNVMMKEIEALKDIALNPSKYKHMFYEDITLSEESTNQPPATTDEPITSGFETFV